VFHEQTQPTATQLVRLERSELLTTAAQLSVTGTIGTLSAHGLVVHFDFVYSCRAGQFDTDGESFLKGGARAVVNGLAPPFLWAHRPSGTQRRGAGF